MPSKKNQTTNYTPSTPMEKFNNIFEIIRKTKEILLGMAAIFLWFLGIWLANRLAPLSDAIRDINIRADACEYRVEKLENNYDSIDTKLDVVKETVARIEGQLSK